MLELMFDYCFTRRQNSTLFGWTVLFATVYALLTTGVAFLDHLSSGMYDFITLCLLAALVTIALHRFARLAWWWYQGEAVSSFTHFDYPLGKSMLPLIGISALLVLTLRLATLAAMKLVTTPLELFVLFVVAAYVSTLLAMIGGVRMGIWLARQQPDPNEQVHA